MFTQQRKIAYYKENCNTQDITCISLEDNRNKTEVTRSYILKKRYI